MRQVQFPDNGKFIGVRSRNETVQATQVIGDPSFFRAGEESEGGKVRVVESGKVVRAICLLNHPIPGTDDSDSCQIIIPQNQVGRKNGRDPDLILFSIKLRCLPLHILWHLDIYIAMVSSTHNVCAKDVYVAIISAIVETENPEAEIDCGLKLLGPVIDKLVVFQTNRSA